MPAITIRNLPDDLVARVKATAASHGRSMEEDVRQLLQYRFRSKEDILQELPTQWKRRGQPAAEEIDAWIEAGRRDG